MSSEQFSIPVEQVKFEDRSEEREEKTAENWESFLVINKLATQQFLDKFDEIYNFLEEKRQEIIKFNLEERLKEKGMTEDEIKYELDYYRTQKLLENLKDFREFILFNIEQKFGKEAADIQRSLFDIMGGDEIIGHALSDHCFSLDLIFYKFIDVKNGSKDVFKMKERIKKEGYFPVIEEFIGKKVEIINNKLKK